MVVFEDEASIASAVAVRLRSEGFTVEIAGDGPTGVALCHDLRPDLVIVALMPPGLDGLERRFDAVTSWLGGGRHLPPAGDGRPPADVSA